MRKFLMLSALGVLLAVPALAAGTPSLFFTPAQIDKIDRAANVPPSLTDIHLGAVLYYRSDNWSVWIDGERWTPETHRTDLQILEVRPEHVKLQVLNGPPEPITLRPHQTYHAATRKIVEGM